MENKTWEEEFDKVFDEEYPSVRNYTSGRLQEFVKIFIRQLLLQKCEEIEGEKGEMTFDKANDISIEPDDYIRGYDAGLSQAITIIKR